ncbi:hypothetical protein PTKU46_80890 [Paraburkholderia terrae]
MREYHERAVSNGNWVRSVERTPQIRADNSRAHYVKRRVRGMATWMGQWRCPSARAN